MKSIVLLCIICSFINTTVYADMYNPCEYANSNDNNSMNQLDTGNDANFERIKQEKNKELVRACQDYNIRLIEQAKGDLERDNY